MQRATLLGCLSLLLLGCEPAELAAVSQQPSSSSVIQASSTWQQPPADTVHLRPRLLARHERFDREQWETFASFDLCAPRALRAEAELFDRGAFLASYRLTLPAGPSRIDLRFRYDPDDRSLDSETQPAHVLVYQIVVDGARQAEGRFPWFGTLPHRWQPLLAALPPQGFWTWPRGQRLNACHLFWFGPDEPHDVALVGEGRVRVGDTERGVVSCPRPVWLLTLRF